MKLVFLAGSFLAFTSSLFAGVKVSAVGLRVVGKEYKEEGAQESLRAFNWTPGTSLALFFQSDSKAIVNFEKEKSTITSFGDDKGTDFLKVKKRFSNKSYSFGMKQESESRKALLTTLESDAIPQSGAKTIKVNGEVVLSVASKSELKKSGKADIKVGEKFEVTGHTFMIEKAGKPKWGEDKLEVTLKSSVDLKSYRKVVFFDAEGKEVESKRGMWSSMGMFGKKTYKTSFTFKEEPKQLVLGLDEWTDLEVVKVPLDLTVGAGL
ncbi:MAG: hypothetical protein ACPGJR_01445 [Akkermansiaceae bacterium]